MYCLVLKCKICVLLECNDMFVFNILYDTHDANHCLIEFYLYFLKIHIHNMQIMLICEIKINRLIQKASGLYHLMVSIFKNLHK